MDRVPVRACAREKCGACGGEPGVLCLGRAGLPFTDAPVYRDELSLRTMDRPCARGGHEGRRAETSSGAGRCREPWIPVLLQVRRLPVLGVFPEKCARDRAARGHFLLHLPGAFLRGRRLPRKGETQAGSFVLRAVHFLLPAAHRRPDRAVQGHRRAVRRPSP